MKNTYVTFFVYYIPNHKSVIFRNIQPVLYELKQGQIEKVRIIVNLGENVEIHEDEWDYPTEALVNNIFGIVGLYLGYSILDLYTLFDSALKFLCKTTKKKPVKVKGEPMNRPNSGKEY